MNNRALRAKLGFKTGAPLSKALGVEPEVLKAWAEEGAVRDEVPRSPADPDADGVVPVEAA